MLIVQARAVNIKDKGNPSFIGRRLQHANAEITTTVKLEKGKDMEAGLVAFQNEKYFYKFVVKKKEGNYYIVFSSPALNSAAVAPIFNEIVQYNPDYYIFLKMKLEGKKLECFYSLNNENWISCGSQDATKLSTSVAGGFVGTYLGLYAFSKSPATAMFDWASYRSLEK